MQAVATPCRTPTSRGREGGGRFYPSRESICKIFIGSYAYSSTPAPPLTAHTHRIVIALGIDIVSIHLSLSHAIQSHRHVSKRSMHAIDIPLHAALIRATKLSPLQGYGRDSHDRVWGFLSPSPPLSRWANRCDLSPTSVSQCPSSPTPA